MLATSDGTKYKVEINKTYYNEILGLAKIENPLPTITIMNNYY